MNFKKGFTLLQVMLCIAVIGLLAALALPAHAQVTPTRTGDGIVGPLLMSDASTNLTAGQKVVIRVSAGKGIAIQPRYVGLGSTNTGTSGFFFSVATDTAGTNFSGTTPIVKTITGNGTTATRGHFVIDEDDLHGATAIQLRTITNAAVNVPGLIISNVFYSISN